MDIVKNSPASGERFEAPRGEQRRVESIPSLAQLQTLFEDAKVSSQQVEAQVSEEAFYVSSGPSVDLPSLDQLSRLKTESEAAEKEPAIPQIRTASPGAKKREQIARVIGQNKKKTPMPVVKVPKAKPAHNADAPLNPLRDSSFDPLSEPLPSLGQLRSYLSEAESSGAENRTEAVRAVSGRTAPRDAENRTMPTLEQLRLLRDEVEAQTQNKWQEIMQGERSPSGARPAAQEAAGMPRQLPTVEQMKRLFFMESENDDAACEPQMHEMRRTAQTQDFTAPAPANSEQRGFNAYKNERGDISFQACCADIRRQSQRQEAADEAAYDRAASQRPASPARSAARDLPTLEQLRSLSEEENEYGDSAFQSRIREIRRSAAAVEQNASIPEEEEFSPMPGKEPQPYKVHYIPYEDFEEPVSQTPQRENAEAKRRPDYTASSEPPEAEKVDPSELETHNENSSFFAERKSRKQKRKAGTARFPYWISSLLQTS